MSEYEQVKEWCLLRYIQREPAYRPKTVILVGNGAVESGSEPLKEFLKENPYLLQDHLKTERQKIMYESDNPISLLAHMSFTLRMSKQLLIESIIKKDLIAERVKFFYNLLSFRRKLAKVYLNKSADGFLKLRTFPDEVLEEIFSFETGVITTNWDDLLWVEKDICNLIQLHGSCREHESLILPTEMVLDEKHYELVLDEYKTCEKTNKLVKRIYREKILVELLAGHRLAIDWLQSAEKVIVWGLAFNPYDAELISLLNLATIGAKKEVILIDIDKKARDTAASFLCADETIRKDVVPK